MPLRTDTEPGLGGSLLSGLPRAYAILFFSSSASFGWMLLAISLLAPAVALTGVVGALAAGTLAWSLGYDRAALRSGVLLFNPLLACLTLACLHGVYVFNPGIWILLGCAASAGGFFIGVVLQQVFARHLGLSAQSLPALVVVYLLCLLAFALGGNPLLPPVTDLTGTTGPLHLGTSFLRPFGSMVFVPSALAGLLVLGALTLASRLSALYAVVAVATGLGTLKALGVAETSGDTAWFGFNFLLCGIALGTSYFAPSRWSLLLAVAGAVACALVTPVFVIALRPFHLPLSVLPYNLVVLTLVYALRQRHDAKGLHPNPRPDLPPETASRFARLNAARFPHLPLPALELPFKDECVVSQAFEGPLTHREAWRWALDLEVVPAPHSQGSLRGALEEYATFNKLVLAPCSGTVTALSSHVPDNRPGANNPAENWGNFVMIRSDAGYHVLLAHLRQRSIVVAAGQRVAVGEVLGRCGNSGRSPLPHLHVQVQDEAWLGAPTRPFCLRNVHGPAAPHQSPRYLTSSIPVAEERVKSAVPFPALSRLFCDWLPGEYRYRITADGAERDEVIHLDFDAAGRFRLCSPRYGAEFTAFLSHQVFYAVDYEGPGDSLLALFAAGLARVPCVTLPQMTWSDRVSRDPFHPKLARPFLEVTEPFFNPGLLTYRYGLSTNPAGGHKVLARLAPQDEVRVNDLVPREIQTMIESRRCVARIEAIYGRGRTLRAALLDSNSAPVAGRPIPFKPRRWPEGLIANSLQGR